MKNKLYSQIKQGQKKPLAIYSIAYDLALAIFEVNTDTVISGFINQGKIEGIKETSIHYTITLSDALPFIIRYQQRYYLRDFIRTSFI